MSQDIKIFNQVIKDALNTNPDAAINLVAIGNVVFGNVTEGGMDNRQLQVPQDDVKQHNKLLNVPGPSGCSAYEIGKIPIPLDAYCLIEQLLELLPEPKLDLLVYCVFKYASTKFNTIDEAAKFLGMNRTTLTYRFKSLGLSCKE